MHAVLTLLLAVLLLPMPSRAAAELPDIGRFHALVIGNNDYRHLPSLKTAVGDATATAELLRERYGYQVTLLKNATRADILRAFNRLRAELTEDDNLLIYYAGHGTLDRVTETGYWLPVDAEEDSDLNWVPNEAISRHLRGMSARHVMVVADSCYSGTLVRDGNATPKTGAARETWLQRIAEKRSRTAITSGGLEPVVDSGAGGHSVFSGAFLRALRDNAGILEGSALFQRISRPIVVAADQTPAYSDIRKAGHEGGEFLFIPRGYVPATAAGAAAPASAPAAPVAPQAALEITFWQSIQNSERAEDFAAYLKQFPQGTFSGLAQSRMAALRKAPEPESGTAALRTGDSFRDCEDCPEMIALAPGRFIMGAAAGTPDAAPNEQPATATEIAKPFALARYETTRAEFEAFVAETGQPRQPNCQVWTDGRWQARAFGWQYVDFEQGGDDPVLCVTWKTARAYTRWLSRKTGQDYRLPSEAEWEYAARAGSTTARPWGHDADAACSFANGADASLDGQYWFERTWRAACTDDHRRTAPAGSFRANAWGLHDMLGNAAEWVADCWREGYGAPASADSGCRVRTVRGGHWADEPPTLRSGARAFHWADTPHAGIGLRVARAIEGPVAAKGTAVAGPPAAAAGAAALPARPPVAAMLLRDSARRLTPDAEGPALGRIPAGWVAQLVAEDDGWAELAAGGRSLGFIERAALAISGQGHIPAGLIPGQSLRDCPDCPELVVIPPGRFPMGDAASGGPVTVDMPRAFALGRFEVTSTEWRACVADGACRDARDSGADGNKPVGNLLWRSGLDYLGWLSARTGQRYRLPSEAEWEYAARNARTFGLRDMTSGQWEWVDDCWNESLAGLPPFGQSRRNGQCSRRLLRGGPAGDEPQAVGLSRRRHDLASLDGGRFDPLYGLRVLRELD